MKREICCPTCAKEWRKLMGRMQFPSTNEDGEGMRQIAGKTRASLTCDGCGLELPQGSPAAAVSIYSLDRPYFEWEAEYLEPSPDGLMPASQEITP